MEVQRVPQGFEKVLQFNVYVRNSKNRDGEYGESVRYTVSNVDERGRKNGDGEVRDNERKEDKGTKTKEEGDTVGSNLKEKVGNINNDEDDQEQQESTPRERKGSLEDTMFKPKNEGGKVGNRQEMTQEKTPPGNRNKFGDDEEDDRAEVKSKGTSGKGKESTLKRGDLDEDEEDDRIERERKRPPSKDKYLQIFVKPKNGKHQLVYSHEGETDEVVHRFSPHRADRGGNVDDENVRTSNFEFDEMPPEHKKPSLHSPPGRDKRSYTPKYDREYDDDIHDRHKEEPYLQRKDPSTGKRRKEKEDDDDDKYEKMRYSDIDTEEERKRLAKKQKDLIRVLEEEKIALKDLVARLSVTLDNQTDEGGNEEDHTYIRSSTPTFTDNANRGDKNYPRRTEPNQLPPPREEYSKLPVKASSRPPNIHIPGDHVETSKYRRDESALSPPPRTRSTMMREDNTKRGRGYEFEREEVSRTRKERLTPSDRDEKYEYSDSKFFYKRLPDQREYDREYMQACRECGDILDRYTKKKESLNRDSSKYDGERYLREDKEERKRVRETRAEREGGYLADRQAGLDRGPATYYIEGTLYGPVAPNNNRSSTNYRRYRD